MTKLLELNHIVNRIRNLMGRLNSILNAAEGESAHQKVLPKKITKNLQKEIVIKYEKFRRYLR